MGLKPEDSLPEISGVGIPFFTAAHILMWLPEGTGCHMLSGLPEGTPSLVRPEFSKQLDAKQLEESVK